MRTIKEVKTDIMTAISINLIKPLEDITAANLAAHPVVDASLAGRGAIASLIQEKRQQEADVIKVSAMKARYVTWQGKNFPASGLDTDGQFKAVK